MPARGAGQRRGLPEDEPAEVRRVESVRVLARVHQGQHAVGVEVLRQRQLDDVARDGRVRVEATDLVVELLLGRVGRQVDADGRDPDLARSRCACRPRRHGCRDRRRRGPCPGPGMMPCARRASTRTPQLRLHARRGRLAVQDHCRHGADSRTPRRLGAAALPRAAIATATKASSTPSDEVDREVGAGRRGDDVEQQRTGQLAGDRDDGEQQDPDDRARPTRRSR